MSAALQNFFMKIFQFEIGYLENFKILQAKYTF